MRTIPPQSDRIYIWLGALSLIYRETQFSTFPCTSRNHFSTCICFGKEEKMATSYRRTCTRSPAVSDVSWTIMRLKCRGAITKITIRSFKNLTIVRKQIKQRFNSRLYEIARLFQINKYFMLCIILQKMCFRIVTFFRYHNEDITRELRMQFCAMCITVILKTIYCYYQVLTINSIAGNTSKTYIQYFCFFRYVSNKNIFRLVLRSSALKSLIRIYVFRGTQVSLLLSAPMRIRNNRIMSLQLKLKGFDQLLFASYLRHAGLKHRSTTGTF